MAPYSSTKIPWMEEPGGLQSIGSLRVGHDWATSLSLFTFMHWRQWQPTPVFLPAESHGWRSLVGYSPWGRKESDTTERLNFHFNFQGGLYVSWTALRLGIDTATANCLNSYSFCNCLSLFMLPYLQTCEVNLTEYRDSWHFQMFMVCCES